MKKINTRARVVIVSLLVATAYVLMSLFWEGTSPDPQIQFVEDLLKGLILGVILYLGTFWALFFKVRGERLITIMLFPSIGILVLSILMQLILVTFISNISQVPLLIISFLVLGAFTYINLLAVNILNTSYLQNIPLAQAAKAAVFIISLIDAFLTFYLIFTNDINIFYRLGIVYLTTVLFSYISLWSIELRRMNKVTISLTVALLMLLLAGGISMWPVGAPYLALALTLTFYVCMNISLEMREIIGKWIWVEYGVIFTLIVFLLVLLSEWGINGPLIS